MLDYGALWLRSKPLLPTSPLSTMIMIVTFVLFGVLAQEIINNLKPRPNFVNTHDPRADFNQIHISPSSARYLSQLKWKNRHPTSCFAYPKYVFTNRSRVSVRVKLARAANPQYRRDQNCNKRETHMINNAGIHTNSSIRTCAYT